MALRSYKRARAAYLDALFGASLPSLLSTHGVYQVTTVTDGEPPEDHTTLWWANPLHSSWFQAEDIKNCTFICYGASTNHYTIAVLLNGTHCRALIDCGASTSIISRGLVDHLGLPISPPLQTSHLLVLLAIQSALWGPSAC